ncbi:unnamed protein product [Phaedon cochleariae]|uniref:THAP-type domain-containing protein n=1 Tax=Phaedon cochleariae TaxID=80249 RepID=A0A9P0D8S4_PHACE|nr:unnamed protein product [Phaedon cochleariae]
MNILCCVPKCVNNAIVHRFPSDIELFNIWIKSVNSTDITFERRDMFRVCDSHFSEEMKFQSYENEIFLKKGAYPDTILQTEDKKMEEDSVPVTTVEKSSGLLNPNGLLLLNNNLMCSLGPGLAEKNPVVDLAQPSTSRDKTTNSKVDGNQKAGDKKNNEEVLRKLGVIISGQLQTTRGQLKKAKRVFDLKCELYKEKLNFVKLKKEKFLVEHILKIKLLKKQLAVEERRLQRNCVRCRRLRQ